MTRFVLSSIALVAGFTLLAAASAAEPAGIDALTAEEKNGGSNSLDQMLAEYSAISRKVAADSGVTLCDLRRAFLDHLKKHNPDNKERGILTGDGVHLNAAGNQFVAAQAAEAIAKALKKETAAAKPDSQTISLFNGKDLSGWHVDVPHLDKNPDAKAPFIVRKGMLVSLGRPNGHLITDAKYENYRLDVEFCKLSLTPIAKLTE